MSKATNACPTSSSLSVALEHPDDLVLTHRVEIVGDPELSLQKPNPPRLLLGWFVDGDDFHQRLAGFGDHERLAFSGLVDEAGQMGLGFMDIDGAHGGTEWTKSG